MNTWDGLGTNLELTSNGPLQSTGDRAELVERIRRQIADGSYETDCKLDEAVGRLIEDMNIRCGRWDARTGRQCGADIGL
jgi:Anti-sigma-28 factor, FlgM